MKLLRIWGVGVVLSLLLVNAGCVWAGATEHQGPSFDCAKATTKVEKMICADAELELLDTRLSSLYMAAKQGVTDPSVLHGGQRQWLMVRNNCDGEECLKDEYRQRIAQFEAASTNVASHEEKSLRLQFKLHKDTGWTVCHDLVENLNKVQPTKPSFACEMQFDPSMKQFGWPEWQELNIEDNLDVIYSIEMELQHLLPPHKPTFEEWREQYLADMEAGYGWAKTYDGKERASFHPRLRQAQMRFKSDGRLETVLAYTRERDAGERCQERLIACPPLEVFDKESVRRRYECYANLPENLGRAMSGIGDHIVLYEPENRKVRFIVSGERGGGASSKSSYVLFLHQSRAYLASVNTSGLAISRVERVEKLPPDVVVKKPWERGRPICYIPSPYPRKTQQ